MLLCGVGGPRFCGCWAAKGLVRGKSTRSLCNWEHGGVVGGGREGGYIGPLGTPWWVGKSCGDMVWSYAREPQGDSDLQASFSRPLGNMMVNHRKRSRALWGRHFSPLSWDAFEDYSYSLLLYGC